MKRIVVFCGSSSGTEKNYEKQAQELGALLAQKNIDLVYGGAKIGLMGAVADAVLAYQGNVIGVLPHFLSSKEIAHDQLSELILVESMHERKMKMNALSDGIIALPGGFGTLEELFEMLTWAQLGLHQKPIGLLNTDGYYNELLAFIQTMVDKGLLKKANQDMLLVDADPSILLQKMEAYQAPDVPKWIRAGQE
ncbi:MAG: TIGR00730 family Rossman fold protein [Bacteroidia bacterium]